MSIDTLVFFYLSTSGRTVAAVGESFQLDITYFRFNYIFI